MKDRELDALVAERVMRRCVHVPGKLLGASIFELYCQKCKVRCGARREDGFTEDLLHYSTDIAAAWEVVEKIGLFRNCVHLYEKGVGVQEGTTWRRTGWCWAVEQFLEPLDHNVVYATAETPARAICLAALEVVKEAEAVTA